MLFLLSSSDLFISEGGISKKQVEFFPEMEYNVSVVTAKMLNEVGIGAALAARAAL